MVRILARACEAAGQTLRTPIPAGVDRVPVSVADACYAEMAEKFPDLSFTLRIADNWHPSDLGAVGYAWLASATLREGMLRLQRYQRTLGERPSLAVREESGQMFIVYEHRRADPLHNRIGAESILSLLMSMCRRNTSGALVAQQVRFRHPPPKNAERYVAFFGCPIQFSSSEDSFALTDADANAPLPTSNIPIALALDQMLANELAKLDRDDVVTRCRREFLNRLTTGAVDSRSVATALHLSERTLQRRLAEADTSFRDLLDHTRHDLAAAYLSGTTKSVTEIAFLVGFSSSSAFARAFSQWSSLTPSQWRERREQYLATHDEGIERAIKADSDFTADNGE